MSTRVSPKDLKILWGRCGNYCAVCKKLLVEDSQDGTAFVVGEAAHICGEKEGAPRYDPTMTDIERNSHSNLILLCPTDHTTIDKNQHDYPVEKLHRIKQEHE